MGNVIFTSTVENRKSGKKTETEFLAEPVFELMTSKGGMTGFHGIIEKDTADLRLYETMKNRASNGLHAGLAALGFDINAKSVDEALKDPRLGRILAGAIEEMIIAVHKETKVPTEEIRAFIMNVAVKGFEETVGDPVTRVARNPLRKTGKAERILAPILNYMKATVSEENPNGIVPKHLCTMLLAEIMYSVPATYTDKYRGTVSTKEEDPELSKGWTLLTETDNGLENFLAKQCGLSTLVPMEKDIIDAMIDIYANGLK